jgi:hypothetical protein
MLPRLIVGKTSRAVPLFNTITKGRYQTQTLATLTRFCKRHHTTKKKPRIIRPPKKLTHTIY